VFDTKENSPMAKRKLSESQRSAIRKELAELLKKAKTKAEAFRAVAKKYNITTITARWYAKTLKGVPARAAKASKAVLRKASEIVARPAARARGHRNGTANGVGDAAGRLLSSLASAAELALARAKRAKKIVPQWQAYVRKELSLRKLEARVRRDLQVAARKAQELGKKVKALTKG